MGENHNINNILFNKTEFQNRSEFYSSVFSGGGWYIISKSLFDILEGNDQKCFTTLTENIDLILNELEKDIHECFQDKKSLKKKLFLFNSFKETVLESTKRLNLFLSLFQKEGVPVDEASLRFDDYCKSFNLAFDLLKQFYNNLLNGGSQLFFLKKYS